MSRGLRAFWLELIVANEQLIFVIPLSVCLALVFGSLPRTCARGPKPAFLWHHTCSTLRVNLIPRVLSLPPSQGPLSASFSGPLSNSFPGASLYLLPRVLFLPPPRLLSILLSVPGSSLYLLPRVLSLPPSKVLPCIRLARRKFELTNHDSAGRKNFTVLTSM